MTSRSRYIVAVVSLLLLGATFMVAVWAALGPIGDIREDTRTSAATTAEIREAIRAVRDSQDIASCRSQLSSDTVGIAQSRFEAASAAIVIGIAEGLIAVGLDDDATLAAKAAEEQAAVLEYQDARTDLASARSEFAARSGQAVTDPQAFLDACRAAFDRPPTEGN